jgi:hypothetical protein
MRPDLNKPDPTRSGFTANTVLCLYLYSTSYCTVPEYFSPVYHIQTDYKWHGSFKYFLWALKKVCAIECGEVKNYKEMPSILAD